ncbi:putative LytR family regulatory protein [Nocardia brasiliensis NBRC 14402]|nr:LytR family transcriptional regulator [Nocardia brasiliensis]GAJ80313.1 putative LytR family regulatory protein [Nocardia brasiliensis NBRC 14402]
MAGPRARARRARLIRQRAERARKIRLTSKAIAAVLAATVFTATGIGWTIAHRFANGFARSAAITADAPRSFDGATNILLIGLDTRKDQDGSDLAPEILAPLHAGDGDNGGYNANTLILIHLPADLKKITAFSIPRDDFVPVHDIPGYRKAKIKEAYGLKKAAVQARMRAEGEHDERRLERAGREAGRASIVRTVRDLTGVPIDRFAEVTLAGFYDLAKALGGVEVCLRSPAHDTAFSGADFPAGRQRLDAAQSLAFVRQRHGLPNGDLDRTHRQQAFLTSVALDLRRTGTFTDIAKLSALMQVAHRNIVLSHGWDVTEFLTALSDKAETVEFRTLPILRYDVIDGQDVNIVDAAEIRRDVREAFGEIETSEPKPTSTVDVINAGQTQGAAAALAAALSAHGYKVGTTSNGVGHRSGVLHPPGNSSDARQLAELLGELPVTEADHVGAGHVEIVLDDDFEMPTGLRPRADPGPTARAPDIGDAFGTQLGSATIPCVH